MIIFWQWNPASVLCFANRITNTELLLGVLNGQAHRSCRIVKLLNRTPTCFNLLCLACLSTFSFVFAVLVTLFNLPDNMLALLSGTSRPHHHVFSLSHFLSLPLSLSQSPSRSLSLAFPLSLRRTYFLSCWVTLFAVFPVRTWTFVHQMLSHTSCSIPNIFVSRFFK